MLTGYQVLIKDEASLVTVLVYQIFASCRSSYIGETCRHFKTSIVSTSKRITSSYF